MGREYPQQFKGTFTDLDFTRTSSHLPFWAFRRTCVFQTNEYSRRIALVATRGRPTNIFPAIFKRTKWLCQNLFIDLTELEKERERQKERDFFFFGS